MKSQNRRSAPPSCGLPDCKEQHRAHVDARPLGPIGQAVKLTVVRGGKRLAYLTLRDVGDQAIAVVEGADLRRLARALAKELELS